MRKNKSIYQQILSIFVLLIIPGYLAYGVFSSFFSLGIVQNKIKNEVHNYAKLLAKIVVNFRSESESLLENLIAQEEKDYAKILPMFSQVVLVEVINEKGKVGYVYPPSPDLIDNDFSYQDSYLKATADPQWSQSFIDSTTGDSRVALFEKRAGKFYLITFRLNFLHEHLDELNLENSAELSVTDNFGYILAHQDSSKIAQHERSPYVDSPFSEVGTEYTDKSGARFLLFKTSIANSDWVFNLAIPYETIYSQMKTQGLMLVLVFAVVGVLTLFLALGRLKQVARDFNTFAHAIAQTADGNYQKLNISATNAELEQIIEAFDRMLDQLALRENAIVALNRTLESKVQKRTEELHKQNITLIETQDKLLQAERLATISTLVAGVAHEINTPIGVSLTASSYVEEQAQLTEELEKKGNLTKQGFSSFVTTVKESSSLITRNLERANRLIVEFKQLSVNQHLREKETCNLKDLVAKAIEVLQPLFRKSQIDWSLEIDGHIELQTYPDSIVQIITNLATNSMSHGFKPGDRGRIMIFAEKLNQNIRLVYEDTGRGIPSDIQDRIFQPFFTTNREAGNTGLGMNIVQNLVTDQLSGTIKIDADRTTGARFIIEFPGV